MLLPSEVIAEIGRHLEVDDRRAAGLAHSCFADLHASFRHARWLVDAAAACPHSIGAKLRALLKRVPLLESLDVVLCNARDADDECCWPLGDAAEALLGARPLEVRLVCCMPEGAVPSVASDGVFLRRMLRPFAELSRHAPNLSLTVQEVHVFQPNTMHELALSHPGLRVERLTLWRMDQGTLFICGHTAAEAAGAAPLRHMRIVTNGVLYVDASADAQFERLQTLTIEASAMFAETWEHAGRICTTFVQGPPDCRWWSMHLFCSNLEAIALGARAPSSRLRMLVLTTVSPAEMLRSQRAMSALRGLPPSVEVVLGRSSLCDPAAAEFLLALMVHGGRSAAIAIPSVPPSASPFATLTLARLRRSAAADGCNKVRVLEDPGFERALEDAALTAPGAVASALETLSADERRLWE